jgi:hypothetical protein
MQNLNRGKNSAKIWATSVSFKKKLSTVHKQSPIGRLFTLVLKIIELAQNFGYLLSRYQLCIIFATKMVGQHFGDFFQKLIWSP